jgi:hypothetical protein
MFIITNPKVAGFVPQWSQFKGFSILFDNPADHLLLLDENRDLKMLSCDIADRKLEFYQTLNKTLSLFPEMLTTYLLCPLPFHSYHVTLWDGINDANVQSVSRDERFAAEDLLQDLPNSFNKESQFLDIDEKRLSIAMEEPIEFQFDKLNKWANSGLAAQLKPANEHSQIVLQKIENEREILIKKYKERFGLETCSQSYTPHVSLGYFANKELAELSTSLIEEWNEKLLQNTSGQTITFTSNSLYGFMSMETFFKL